MRGNVSYSPNSIEMSRMERTSLGGNNERKEGIRICPPSHPSPRPNRILANFINLQVKQHKKYATTIATTLRKIPKETTRTGNEKKATYCLDQACQSIIGRRHQRGRQYQPMLYKGFGRHCLGAGAADSGIDFFRKTDFLLGWKGYSMDKSHIPWRLRRDFVLMKIRIFPHRRHVSGHEEGAFRCRA